MTALILLTDIVEKLILLALFSLSVWSITIMVDRRRLFRSEQKIKDLEVLKKSIRDKNTSALRLWTEQHHGFLSGVIAAMLSANSPDLIDRAVSSFIKEDRIRLEKGLAVLATLGANAPFIGLFGTVLGIIRAFAYLGSQSGSASVMSGVSQALYATALGLLVAIPAVISFNVFSKKIKDLNLLAETLRDLYIAQGKN